MICITASSLRLTNQIHTPHPPPPLQAGSWMAKGPCLEQSEPSAGWGSQLHVTLPEIISLSGLPPHLFDEDGPCNLA